MINNIKSKYTEWLLSKEFELKRNPKLSDENYLINHENILVNTCQLKCLPDRYLHSYFRRVVFLPSHFYEKKSYEIKIKDKVVDLLQCMYVVQEKTNNIDSAVKISIQNFHDYKEDLPFYQITFQNNNLLEIQAGILGEKYIILTIQSSQQIDIKIFNLDLTLVFEYQKEHFIEELESNYYLRINSPNYFDNEIDYCEPGLIYILGFQILIKIDLNKNQVNTLRFVEQFKVLLRLMPITQSEFKYYFKNKKSNTLLGYDKNDQELTILFAIVNQTIYQINMHNLEVIRETKIQLYQSNNQQKLIQSAFVVPIGLQDRQRKTFSKWTFLINSKQNHYSMHDWKEQSLFKKQKKQDINPLAVNFSQRIYLLNNSIFILFQNQLTDQSWKTQNASASFEIQVKKKKGEKNYDQTLLLRSESSKFYFSQNFLTKNFFHPILYKNELAYPSYMETSSGQYQFFCNFIGFHSFKEQSDKQLQYKVEPLNSSDYQKMKNNNINYITFQTNKKIILQKINENQITTKQFQLSLRPNQEIQDYFFSETTFEQFFITYQNQIYKLNSYQLREENSQASMIQDDIQCYSQFTFDKTNKNLLLPLIYYEGQDLYFGIYDLNKQQIIQQTVHLFKYTYGILSHYDEQKKEFTLLFFKKILNSCYLYFYSLNMIKFHFKFINMHKFEQQFQINQNTQYLNVKNKTFEILIPQQINVFLKFDSNKKFELKKQVKNSLAKYEFDFQYEIDFKRQYYFLSNPKNSSQIFYLGVYRGSQHKLRNMLSIYDVKQSKIQFINNVNPVLQQDYEEEEDIVEQQRFCFYINQLITGEILISEGDNQISLLKKQF